MKPVTITTLRELKQAGQKITCLTAYEPGLSVSGTVTGATGTITTTSPPPAVCAGAACTVDQGATVSLIAPSVAGSRLAGWSGCAGTRQGAGLLVLADADVTCLTAYEPGLSDHPAQLAGILFVGFQSEV